MWISHNILSRRIQRLLKCHLQPAELDVGHASTPLWSKGRLFFTSRLAIMVNLIQLPGELINEICSFLLDRRDLQSLRLCCKRLKDKSAFAFDDRFLGVVKVILTRQSLQELIDLSKQERFQKAIKEIQLCTVTFSNRTRAKITGRPLKLEERQEIEQIAEENDLELSEYAWPGGAVRNPHSALRPPPVAKFERDLKLKRRRIHDKQKHDQNTMRTQGIDVELLSTALKNLSALKTFKITADCFGLPHRPLGFKELFFATGIHPEAYRKDEESKVVKIHSTALILGAMLRSGHQLERLIFQNVPYYLPLAKTSTSRKVSRTSTPSGTLALDQIPMFNLPKMRSFTLMMIDSESRSTLDSKISNPLSWATKLLTRMTSLRKLCLNGDSALVDRHLIDHLVTEDLSLPRLQTLELLNCGFSIDTFEQILGKVEQTLKTLICYNCWAIQMTTDQVLETLKKSSALTHTNLVLRSPKTGMQQRRIINAKTPADFKKELDDLAYYYSGLKM